MTPNDFKEYRLSGFLSDDKVELWAIEGVKTWRDNQVYTHPSIRLTMSDCMAFAGLSVFIHTEHYTQTLVENYELLKKVANYILVVVEDFGDDLGFDWRKE